MSTPTTPSTTIVRAPNQMTAIRAELEQPAVLQDLARVLPPQIAPQRFVAVVIMAIQQQPTILNCSRASLLKAAIRAAADGLLPDGREAALVPFGKEVQYLPMIAGRLKKIRQSGQLRAIDAQLVYDADEFSYWIDETGPHLKHVPDLAFQGRGHEPRCRLVYAVAQMLDGGVYIETMTAAEVEQIRAVSRAKDGPMWRTWWGEAAKKSVVNRLSKRLPISTDLATWLDREPDEQDPIAQSDETVDHQAREASVRAQGRRHWAAELEHQRARPAEAAAGAEATPTASDVDDADDTAANGTPAQVARYMALRRTLGLSADREPILRELSVRLRRTVTSRDDVTFDEWEAINADLAAVQAAKREPGEEAERPAGDAR